MVRGHPCPPLPCRSRGAPTIWMHTQAWPGLGEACPGVSRPGPSPSREHRRPPPAGVRGVGSAVVRGHPCPHLPCRSRGAPMIWMHAQAWLGLGEACPRVSRPGPSPPWERRRPRRQGSVGWRWFPPMKVARMPEDQTASPHPDPVRTGSRRRHQTRLPVVPDPEREGRDAVPAWCARLTWNRDPAVVSGRWGWEDSPQARDGYSGCHRACAQACSSTMR